MSRYTIELRSMVNDPFFNLFDFNYDFYAEDKSIKSQFEERFIDHYYFDEIGSETVARFKHMLRSRLNMIMPYYRQLYEAELQVKEMDINWLLNKDLEETFTRTLETQGSDTSNASGSSTSSGNSTADSKVSNLENGVASASLSSSNLTGVSNDTNVSSNNSSNQSSVNSTNNSSVTETTKMVSRGNIGVTSSAQLLKEYREIIINIDQMIIDECRDLFMLVY